MVFSSFTFLLCFLPLTLVCYYLARGVRARNAVLCLFSLVFYAWGEPVYVLLMLASIGLNYLFGLLLGKWETPGRRKAVMIAALVFNLGAIALFKYGNFILENLGLLLGSALPRFNFSLPLGISFYTFQILSYVLDVYNRKTPVQKSLLRLATYIVLFPQLVAGPIVRYDQVQAELQERRETLADFVNFSTEYFPAQHYGLVLWDHGAGPLWGYGSDELFDNDSLLLVCVIHPLLQLQEKQHQDFLL